jgi:protein-tyrosine phosphatase
MNHTIHFYPVGNGRLSLHHFLGKKSLDGFEDTGCTHVVTLLRDTERAESIGRKVQEKGLTWLWVPVANGKYPRGEVHERLMAAISQISALLDNGASVLIHCAAGIHRTGMLAYGLLRWRGLNPEEALETIGKIRPVTRDGILPRHIRWGDEVARLHWPENDGA